MTTPAAVTTLEDFQGVAYIISARDTGEVSSILAGSVMLSGAITILVPTRWPESPSAQQLPGLLSTAPIDAGKLATLQNVELEP